MDYSPDTPVLIKLRGNDARLLLEILYGFEFTLSNLSQAERVQVIEGQILQAVTDATEPNEGPDG